MKKLFIIFTEQGRVKGRVSGTILKKDDKVSVVGDFDYSAGMNKGNKAEVVAELVKLKELPEEAIDKAGYPNYELLNEIAEFVVIEGKGLNYYSIF